MARTDNTMPLRLQEEDGKRSCWTAGGSYRGLSQFVRYANRSDRRRVRVQLTAGREPSVAQAKHGVKYSFY